MFCLSFRKVGSTPPQPLYDVPLGRNDPVWTISYGVGGLTLCRDRLWVRTVQRPCRVSTDCWWSRVGSGHIGQERIVQRKENIRDASSWDVSSGTHRSWTHRHIASKFVSVFVISGQANVHQIQEKGVLPITTDLCPKISKLEWQKVTHTVHVETYVNIYIYLLTYAFTL